MHREHDVGHSCAVGIGECVVHAELEPVADDATRERIAVGVQPIAGECDENIALPDPGTRDDLRLVNDAHDEAGEIVIGRGVDARHLSGFPADKGAAILATPRRNARYHPFHDVRQQLPERDVVQEEHRHGALHENVVGAVIDEAVPDGVVAFGLDGDFDFGSHAISAGDQQRRAIPLGHAEHATKATKRAARAGGHG